MFFAEISIVFQSIVVSLISKSTTHICVNIGGHIGFFFVENSSKTLIQALKAQFEVQSKLIWLIFWHFINATRVTPDFFKRNL